jgi:hypothetical protein
MTKRRRGPLRKVVGRDYGNGQGELAEILFEVLECGHRQLPIEDIYGETHATRRRCPKCATPEPEPRA